MQRLRTVAKSVIVIEHHPNALVPLPKERKVFSWNAEEFCYSQKALDYIELLMMSQESFTVKTSATGEYEHKRSRIVERILPMPKERKWEQGA